MGSKLASLIPKSIRHPLPTIPHLRDDARHREPEARYLAIRKKLTSLDADILAERRKYEARLSGLHKEHDRKATDEILAGTPPVRLEFTPRHLELQEQKRLLERQYHESHHEMTQARNELSKEILDEHREWRVDLARQQHSLLTQALELAEVQVEFRAKMDAQGLNSGAREWCQIDNVIRKAIDTLTHHAKQAYWVDL